MARFHSWAAPGLGAPGSPEEVARWLEALPPVAEPDPANLHGSSDLMRVSLPDGRVAVRKRHWHVGVRGTLRGIGRFTWFAPSRGRHEGEWLVMLAALGLADGGESVPPVPQPLAWAESRAMWATRSWVLMAAIEGVQPLDVWLDAIWSRGAPPGERGAAFATLAAISRAIDAMHRAGVAHLDLHWRNLLVRPRPLEDVALFEAADWWLIDGIHARWGTASTRIIDADRIADQAAWLQWLDLLQPSDAERLSVTAPLSGERPGDASEAWRARVRWEMTRQALRERRKALRRMPALSAPAQPGPANPLTSAAR